MAVKQPAPPAPQPDLSAPIHLGETWVCPTGHINMSAAATCGGCR